MAVGFHRLGLVAASPVALLGIGTVVIGPFTEPAQWLTIVVIGLVIAAAAVPIYVAARLLAWIIDGFLGGAR